VGQSYPASAAGFDQTGKPMSVQATAWSTEAPAVATVNASGVVAGVSPGLTTLSVLVGAKQGYTALTVIPVPVAKLSVAPAIATVNVGLSVQLSATLLDAGNNALTGRTIAWTSSDAARAPVSPSGLVTAMATGTFAITATCEGISAQAAITVPETVVRVASVALSPSMGSVLVGQTFQLSATPKDAAGNNLPGRSVAWTSDAPGVATVNSTGLVAAVAAGAAIITAAADGASSTSTITVVDDLAIYIVRPDSVGPVGDTLFVQAGIQSIHGVAIAEASVEPNIGFYQTALCYCAVGKGGLAWSGTMLVRDLKTGDYQLVITVLDSFGTTATGAVSFHHVYGHEGGNGPAPGKKQILPPTRPRLP
jgi:uncharacterized protein YjdB